MVKMRGAWLAQLVEHANLGLRIVGLCPLLGVEMTLKINKIFFKKEKPTDLENRRN